MIRIKFYSFIFFGLVFYGVNAQSLEEKELIAEGNTFYNEQEWELAQAKYGKALTIRPSSTKANYNMGNLLYEQKLYTKAQPYYERALKNVKDPLEKASVLHNLGNNLMKQKKYKDAKSAYKQSLLLRPKDNQTRYNYVLATKLLQQKDNQNKNNQKPLPKPSLYAQQLKSQADKAANNSKFLKALKILKNGLEKDSTVIHYQRFMDKLNEIIILDSLK